MKKTLKDFGSLLDDVAAHLCGRTVKTIFNYSTTSSVRGVAFRVGDQAAVGLNPAIAGEDETEFFTWLHELGHIRAQYHRLANYKSFSDLPRSFTLAMSEAEIKNQSIEPDENMADTWGAHWMNASNNWASFDKYSETAVRLKSLLNYQP